MFSLPLKQARLDLFLISDHLSQYIEKCNIDAGYRSDHSIISIDIKFNHFDRGKGLWKFNNSLLKDPEYREKILDTIKRVKTQYCIPIYNTDNIDIIDDSEIQFTICDQLFLETLFMEFRGATISYAFYKKTRIDQTEKTNRRNKHVGK